VSPGLYISDFSSRLRQLSGRRPFEFPRQSIPSHFRRASVLIPFWVEDGVLRVLFTERAAHLSGHPGQVSFAGGRLEPGESWEQAAVREAHEEVGLDPARVEVLGRLDDAWSGAGHHLVPVVAWVEGVPHFEANPGEVAELLMPSVADLLRPEAQSEEEVEHRGMKYRNRIVEWPGGGRVYGLSTDLLLEALEWGTGGEPERGPVRLQELQSFMDLDPAGP
jgi:8-oxo-dGTP pyrophosphatase MutT (NUDIX family)